MYSRFLTALFLLFTITIACRQAPQHPSAEAQIRQVMEQQVKDWNSFNIEGFMKGYWKSDSLEFISKKGVNYGWQKVMDNYKKHYDTKEKTGVLTFSDLKFEPLGQDTKNNMVYMVIGKWEVKQQTDTLGGYFSLIFKKIDGEWKIVSDHTS